MAFSRSSTRARSHPPTTPSAKASPITFQFHDRASATSSTPSPPSRPSTASGRRAALLHSIGTPASAGGSAVDYQPRSTLDAARTDATRVRRRLPAPCRRPICGRVHPLLSETGWPDQNSRWRTSEGMVQIIPAEPGEARAVGGGASVLREPRDDNISQGPTTDSTHLRRDASRTLRFELGMPANHPGPGWKRRA